MCRFAPLVLNKLSEEWVFRNDFDYDGSSPLYEKGKFTNKLLNSRKKVSPSYYVALRQ